MSNPSSLTPAAPTPGASSTNAYSAPSQPTFGIPDPATPSFQIHYPDQFRVGGYVGGGAGFENVVLLPPEHGQGQQQQGEAASGSSPRAAHDPAPTPPPTFEGEASGSDADTGLNKFMRLVREGKAAAHSVPGEVFTLPYERPGKNLK